MVSSQNTLFLFCKQWSLSRTRLTFCFFTYECAIFFKGQCDLNRFTGGYYNDAEASYIKDFIVDLLQKYPNDLDQSDIVVVASYRDQVSKFSFENCLEDYIISMQGMLLSNKNRVIDATRHAIFA